MDCCIYILYWNIDNPYIGQTTNFTVRKNRHYNEILNGKHCNYKILEQYSLHNTLPNIDILIRCTTSELNDLEEIMIKEFNSIDKGLNIISGGYSVGKGVHNSFSKYSREQLIKAFEMLADINNSYKCISEATSISLDTIKKMGQGVQHTWLHEEFPELYQKILTISTKDRYAMSACAKSQGKKYSKIMSPTGEIFEVTNTLRFSKEHDLPNGNLCLVLSGHRNSVKGWKRVQ